MSGSRRKRMRLLLLRSLTLCPLLVSGCLTQADGQTDTTAAADAAAAVAQMLQVFAGDFVRQILAAFLL